MLHDSIKANEIKNPIAIHLESAMGFLYVFKWIYRVKLKITNLLYEHLEFDQGGQGV